MGQHSRTTNEVVHQSNGVLREISVFEQNEVICFLLTTYKHFGNIFLEPNDFVER